MDAAARRRAQHTSARHYIDRPITDTALMESARLTAQMFSFPMSRINVLDAESQHTIAAYGMPLDVISRSESFCHQVVRDGVPTQLEDMERIPVSGAHIRSYIGVPITGREGLVIGTLCLMDTVPRPFTAHQVHDLKAAAAIVRDQLELLRRLGPAPAGSVAGAAALAAALDGGQIVPHYQPVISLHSGRMHSVEALARWQHPDRGLIPPSGFVPLAEDSDLIIDLDLAMLRQAAADLAIWHRTAPGLRLNVNLSAHHFDHEDCVGRLAEAVAAAGVSPEYINLEVTETAALAAHPGDHSYLSELRSQGFRVILDDFGTGFSSMEQVMRLPIDGIKLDRSITAAMGTRVGDAVVRALIGLADDLDLDSVMEGVETRDQADRARRSGCRHGQGHLYGRAVPAREVPGRLPAPRTRV